MSIRQLGQFPFPNVLEALGPGLMYVQLSTPLGVAVVDPFAPPDPTTQAIMQRLGIEVTVGFGEAPAPEPGASLASNVGMLGLTLAGGALAFYLRPKLSTLLVVGAGFVLVSRGLISPAFAAFPGPP